MNKLDPGLAQFMETSRIYFFDKNVEARLDESPRKDPEVQPHNILSTRHGERFHLSESGLIG